MKRRSFGIAVLAGARRGSLDLRGLALPRLRYGYEEDGRLVTGAVPCSEVGALRLPADVRSFLEPTIEAACGR